MQISIAGQQIDVGAALSDHVQEQLEKTVSKYFENAIKADVVFSKESHLFCTDIVVNEGTGTGIVIKSQAKENDIYAAFDTANDRIEKQLRRYKRRIKNHHKQKLAEIDAAEILAGKKYVIAEHTDMEAEPEEDSPLIIAEKPMQIDVLSVSDAVMHMNLANLPALVFINKQTGKLNVVYHRKDGNISWVDPEIAEEVRKAS